MGKDEFKHLSKNDLVRLILRLDSENVMLKKRLDAIENRFARSRKNSSTSSKPPSSDIAKPPKPRTGGKKRKIGGQPGHKKHEQKPLPPKDVDAHNEYRLTACPCCGGGLKNSSRPPRRKQQVDLVGRSVRVTEQKVAASWCPGCQSHHYAEFPPEMATGFFTPRMKALVAYFKGACHMSYATIQKFLADVYRIPASTGYLTKVVLEVGVALGVPYKELLDVLPDAPVLNVDETGHKDCGKRHWTWCFRAAGYTVFRIDPSRRGACVLKEVLGDAFGGVLGADYYSAYRSYMGEDVRIQSCMAHLIRDVRFLTTLVDKVTKNYGERVLKALKALFKIYHRREKMSPGRFLAQMEKAKQHLIKKALGAPPRGEAQNMARRFKENAESYFRFITTPGVEPTNNAAEQAIRFVVIDRRITQGTRGTNGQRWSERIWTTMATCAAQGRSTFKFICQAVDAHFSGVAPPSLLPS